MQSFEQKAVKHFGEFIINKHLIHEVGLEARDIPAFVAEYILAGHLQDGQLTHEVRDEITAYVSNYRPTKDAKQDIKSRLVNRESVQLLDDYRATPNLKTDSYDLHIPLLDVEEAQIGKDIVRKFPTLTTSGVWGLAELIYSAPDDNSEPRKIRMGEFEPVQATSVDIERYRAARSEFTIEEWLNLIVSSTGFSPRSADLEQKLLYVSCLLPLVEPSISVMEAARNGMGKSLVYQSLSRYTYVVSGRIATPALLLYDAAAQTDGLVTRYDAVVLDDAVLGASEDVNDLAPELKAYLKSGQYRRGNTTDTAKAGVVMLKDAPIYVQSWDTNNENQILYQLANHLKATTLVDELDGIIPGWKIHTLTDDKLSRSLGLRGDYFSEILHAMRSDMDYGQRVLACLNLTDETKPSDRKAIVRLATGYLKLLFPDLEPSTEQFQQFCVRPAVELRQRMRYLLHHLDHNNELVRIGIR